MKKKTFTKFQIVEIQIVVGAPWSRGVYDKPSGMPSYHIVTVDPHWITLPSGDRCAADAPHAIPSNVEIVPSRRIRAVTLHDEITRPRPPAGDLPS